MNLAIKLVIGLLLLFNGLGALYGGANLILHPDGSSLGMGLHWLNNTPFQNYLIPGIILFIFNGLTSLLAILFILIGHKKQAILVMAQGLILLGWIIIQMFLISTVNMLHIVMGTTGLLLIFFGRQLESTQTPKRN